MSNSFPSMISNEPPPLNLSSDEDDSEEFRTPGLKLDLSAEPSPLSTPHKVGKSQISNLVQEDYLKPSKAHAHDADTSSVDLSLTNGHDEDSNSSSIASKNNNDSPSKDDNQSPVNNPSNIHLKPELTNSVSDERSPTPDSHNTSSIGSPTEDEFEDCQPPQLLPVTSPLQDKSTQDVESFEDAKADSKDAEIELELNSSRKSSVGDAESGAFADKKAECDSISIVNNNDTTEKCTGIPAFVAATSSSFHEKSDNISVESKASENETKSSTDFNKSEINSEVAKGASNSEHSSVDTCIKEDDVTAITEFYAANDSEDDDFEDFQNGKSQESNPVIADVSYSVPNNLNSLENEFETKAVLPDDDFSDFNAFESNFNVENSASTEAASNISNNDMKTSYIGAADGEIEDDDFGDFSSMPLNPPTTNPLGSIPFPIASAQSVSAQNDEEDEFADFENFKAAPTSVSQSVQSVLSSNTSTFPSLMSPRGSADYSAALESKFESVVKAMIPLDEPSLQNEIKDNQSLQNLDKELQESRDPYWSHVKDFEESKGLLYKWLNSLCQQKLYKSLKIDTSTIVYTERWGAIEVPRFAASMVETALLQPQVCPSTSRISDSSEHQQSDSRSKMSASDDNNSTSSTIVTGKRPLSKEAQQILQQLPDISFMRAKTLVFPQAAAPSSSLL